MEFLLVLSGILHEVHILRRDDHFFGPMAKEFDIRHEINVWLPEGLVPLEILIDKVDGKCDLLPIGPLLL